MSEKVNVKIDGKEVKVAKGINLIQAAEAAGVHIPNLCFLKGMKGIGACRMCLVEVEGMKTPIIACTSRVKDGMSITTTTESIEETRKFIIDLILSMHPLDCMTCTKAGVCTLQQYAYDFGIKESSFTRKDFGYPVDSANPFIKRDPDYCILCGRCVRVCKEQGTNVLDFMGRGVGSKVVTAQDKPLQESECTFCGSCVDACPVNALLEADRWRKGREWEYKKTSSTCLSCGNGCSIVVSTKDDEVAKINSAGDSGTVEKYICATGRFGFDALTSDLRINTPMKRVGKKLEETTWDDALAIVAERLKKSGKNASIVSTANILNEDAVALAGLASAVKTKNIDTTASLYTDADTMKLSATADLDTADVIVVAGLKTSQHTRVLPALDAAITKRVARGAKLVEIDNAKSLAAIAASLVAKGAKSTPELDAAIGKAKASEESDRSADLIAGASSPVILCSPSLFAAANNLSLVSKASVVAVPFEANARGVVLSGLTADAKSYSDMVSGKNDVLYVIGEPPLKKVDAKFLIVQTPYLSYLTKQQADVVLPAASYLESSGTMVSYLGKIKKVAKAASPAGDAKQHKDIFADIAAAMKAKLTAKKVDVKKALKVTKAKPAPFEKLKGLDVNPVDLNARINCSVINSSRLLWLKETEKAAAAK